MRRSSREVSDSIQRQSGGFQLSNREQTTENRCRRRSSGEFKRRTRYSQSGRQSSEHRMSSVRDSKDHLSPPRSRRQWRRRRKPKAANVRRSCRVKETSRAKTIWHEESNQIGTALHNIHQIKIPAHRLNRRRSAQEINKYVSDDVRAENKPNTAKTKEAEDFSKSEAVLVGVTDTLQHWISNIEKEKMAKNPTFLQKGIDTRNTNNAMVALITLKTSRSKAFSEQCQ